MAKRQANQGTEEIEFEISRYSLKYSEIHRISWHRVILNDLGKSEKLLERLLAYGGNRGEHLALKHCTFFC